MKLNKLQLIECLNYVRSRSSHQRAGQAFSTELSSVNNTTYNTITGSHCDMYYNDKSIIDFVKNYCDQEAMQYFYSSHSQDLFKI